MGSEESSNAIIGEGSNSVKESFALDDAPDSETRTGELEQEIEAGDPAEDNAEEPTIDEKINAAAAYIELDDWAQKAYDNALAKGDTKTADLIQKQRAASRMAKDLRRQAKKRPGGGIRRDVCVCLQAYSSVSAASCACTEGWTSSFGAAALPAAAAPTKPARIDFKSMPVDSRMPSTT